MSEQAPIDVYPDQRITCLDCGKDTWIRWNGTAYQADDPTWTYHTNEDEDAKSKMWNCGDLSHHTRMSGIRARTGFRLYSRNDADRTEDVADPTPGPWKLSALKNCSNGYPDSLAVVPETTKGRRGPAICLLSPLESVTMNDEANARLIAAAPDLLAVLSELADLMDAVRSGEYTPDSFTTQPARIAIAKAVGRKP